jgi:polysaccharide deacetylase family protein (PEP-CTERM system associated)
LRSVPVPLVPPSDPHSVRHAFTVDVEDWYQSCIDFDAPISERVVRNVHRILALLDRTGTRGTFFVQGLVAEAYPGLVQELVRDGHEVQAHGYSHRPLNRMDRAALRDELVRAKKSVEDAAGVEVTAFRAQDFSVIADNAWALETMASVGYSIDSSIFPMRAARYGIAKWPLAPHRVLLGDAAELLEVPVAIWSYHMVRVPVAGGGYFRLLPERVLAGAIRGIESAGRPAVIYCHPYEFAPDELLDYPLVSWRFRKSQTLGRASFERRMQALLEHLPFGRLNDVLTAWSCL